MKGKPSVTISVSMLFFGFIAGYAEPAPEQEAKHTGDDRNENKI